METESAEFRRMKTRHQSDPAFREEMRNLRYNLEKPVTVRKIIGDNGIIVTGIADVVFSETSQDIELPLAPDCTVREAVVALKAVFGEDHRFYPTRKDAAMAAAKSVWAAGDAMCQETFGSSALNDSPVGASFKP